MTRIRRGIQPRLQRATLDAERHTLIGQSRPLVFAGSTGAQRLKCWLCIGARTMTVPDALVQKRAGG